MKSAFALFVVFSFLLFSKKTALLKPKLSRTFSSLSPTDSLAEKKRVEERALIIIITSSSLLFEREKERESVESVERERVCRERERERKE